MNERIIKRLYLLAEKCVEYVGSYNTPEREKAAKAALQRGLAAALDGDEMALLKVKIISGEFGQSERPQPFTGGIEGE